MSFWLKFETDTIFILEKSGIEVSYCIIKFYFKRPTTSVFVFVDIIKPTLIIKSVKNVEEGRSNLLEVNQFLIHNFHLNLIKFGVFFANPINNRINWIAAVENFDFFWSRD